MKLKKKLFFIQENGRACLPGALLNFSLVMGFFVAVFWLSLGAINVHMEFWFLGQFWRRIWDGFLMTVGISAASLILSLLLGLLYLCLTLPISFISKWLERRFQYEN